MDFWDHYVAVIRKYSDFDGRSSRREFWSFTLVSVIISIAVAVLDGALGFRGNFFTSGPLGTMYALAVFVPEVAVAIRRNHDVGMSGWFVLVPFYNLYLILTPGDEGRNEYGPDPYDSDEAADTADDEDDDPLIK